MFLFLSKLLPLLFYPLGLACMLMVVALVTLGKRPRQAAFAITLALTILLVGSNGWVAQMLVRSLEFQNIPHVPLPTTDAIVVLGGGTKPATYPRPGVDLNEQGDRVFYAAQLYHQQKAPLIIASGGRIDWRRTKKSPARSEAADMTDILLQLGVPASAIMLEPDSLNTYQNAVNVKKIVTQHHIRQILLVTSAMHMPRALYIFQRQGINAVAAPTDFLVTNSVEKQGSLQSTLLNLLPEAERLLQFTLALKEYIGLFVYHLRG